MFRLRLAVFGATVALGATFVPAMAAAQTISASGQPYPNRYVNGNNEGYSTRPQNLNPLGISYDDCTKDMTLQFSVTLSGFTGADSVQVWASLNSDCTDPTDRGIGGGVDAVCWGLRTGNIAGLNISTPQTYSFNVRVQDLVGWQTVLPTATEAANPPAKGPEACTAQATFAAVPINVNFLAIDSSGNSDGTPYQYTINTDMVGPPAPSGVGETVGDTIYNVTWTANSDSDTAGYDVFIDPIPGQEDASGIGVSLEGGGVRICPDSGSTISDATVDDGDETAVETGVVDTGIADTGGDGYVPPLPYDGGCYVINKGGQSTASANGYTCNDSILASSIENDGGGGDAESTTTTTDVDGSTEYVEGGIEEGNGGISTIPLAYLVNGSSGFTIADKSVGSYTIKGLHDGTTYTVVVASVDGTGNIGPPSLEVCDYPAPVKDFWEIYQQDGGNAGGFCALETVGTGGASSLAGVAGILGFAALLRRRSRAKK